MVSADIMELQQDERTLSIQYDERGFIEFAYYDGLTKDFMVQRKEMKL